MAFVIFERPIRSNLFEDKSSDNDSEESDPSAGYQIDAEVHRTMFPRGRGTSDPKETEDSNDPNDHSKDTPHEHALTADPKDTTPTTKHDFGSHAGTEEVAAATAVAGAIGVAAYNIYKRFFSTAAKACKDKSGSEKTDCMQEYKQKGTVAYNSLIQRNMGRCDKSKDPNACKESLRLKMKKGK